MIVTTNNKHYTDIANAIRLKSNIDDVYKPSEMANAILDIKSKEPKLQEKDINFYDYDGTLLYTYTLSEIQELTELPELPEQEGLICQEWNYNLTSIKSVNHKLNVGATYITDDDKTRLYIYLTDIYRLDVPLYFSQSISEGVIINWGDGTEPETLFGAGSRNITHSYAESGFYLITLEPIGNCELGFGAGYSSYSVIGNDLIGYRNVLYKVEIGKNVTTIGSGAFYKCNCLQSITIPKGLKYVNGSSFSYCYSLECLVFPDELETIAAFSINYCYELQIAIIPNTVTSIGTYTFSYCHSLKSIILSPKMSIISDNIFYNCFGLKDVIIPDKTTEIGNSSFYGCYSLLDLLIPNNVEIIKGSAFYNCTAMNKLILGESITEIESYAFNGCTEIQTITLHENIEKIGVYGFSQCKFVKNYFIYSIEPPILDSDNVFSQIATDCIIHVPVESLENYKNAQYWSIYADKIVGDL